MAQDLGKILKKRLKKAKRLALVGVGSGLRGDDIAGMLVAEAIGKYSKNIKGRLKLKVFFGETAPENLTGEIRAFKPTHVIMVDSADMGKAPGEAALLDTEDTAGFSSSTHQLPIGIMLDYLRKSLKCDITVIGIQPKNLAFGERHSKETANAARRITAAIKDLFVDT